MDSYKRIASEYGLPGRDDPNIDTLQLVKNWLETKCPFEWSMVVDNLDERAGFLEQSEDSETKKAFCEYVPQTAQGTILYTSRSRDIAIDLSPGKDPIMVQGLKLDEAQALLGKNLVSKTLERDQIALFEGLDYLPLAIAQAAAYMTKRRKRVAEYLILIQDNSTRSQILSQRGYIRGRTERSSESIVSTWWVTFRLIKRENPRAAELLSMMSLLDRHEIPISIMQEPDEGIFGFEKAIDLLEDFSLITKFPSVNSCHEQAIKFLKQMICKTRKSLVFGEMHRLVQESTKAWLGQANSNEADGNAADTATKTLQCIGRYFELIPEKIKLCTFLYPHLNASLSYNSENFEIYKQRFAGRPGDIGSRVIMLQRTCLYSMLQTKFRQSEQHIRLAVSICEMYLGDHHKCTLESMELYSMVLMFSGRGEQACAIQGQVLCVREEMLGHHHSKTLKAVDSLGQLLTIVGNLEAAEKLLCRGLSGKQQNFLESPEDNQSRRNLISTMTGLASVFVTQGEHQRALDLLNEALNMAESNEVYQDCRWNVMKELALCFCQCGKYRDAHSFIEPAIEGQRALFGDTHPITLHSRRQLVKLLWAEGRLDEAEKLMTRVFEGWTDFNDLDSPERVDALCSIGRMQYSRGKFEEAEIFFKRGLHMVVSGGQDWSSKSRHTVYNIQQDLRDCLESQGKLEESITYILPSRQIFAPNTEETSEFDRLRERGRILFAKSHFGASMATSMTKLMVPVKSSEQDENDTRNDLGISLLRQGKYEEAYQLGQDNLALTKRAYGWNDYRTQLWVRLLATASELLGRLGESEDHWRRLLYWHNRQFKQHHLILVQAYYGIAKLMALRRHFEAAEQACKRGLAIHPAHLKTLQPRLVVNTLYTLGHSLMSQGKMEEAETELKLAYTYSIKTFSPSDAMPINFLVMLAIISEKTGNNDRAEKLYYLLGITVALPSMVKQKTPTIAPTRATMTVIHQIDNPQSRLFPQRHIRHAC